MHRFLTTLSLFHCLCLQEHYTHTHDTTKYVSSIDSVLDVWNAQNISVCSRQLLLLLHYTRLMALFPGLPGSAGTRKVKPIWILLEQETVSGSGISWAVCKSTPRSRQITMPAPHHWSFLQAGCPSCRPTNNVKALKDTQSTIATINCLGFLAQHVLARNTELSLQQWQRMNFQLPSMNRLQCLQCFDTVGWAAGGGGVLAWLFVWSDVQICICPSWCHCHSLSLASVKSRLVLPFWYRLTRVVPDTGPLNGCVCVWID